MNVRFKILTAVNYLNNIHALKPMNRRLKICVDCWSLSERGLQKRLNRAKEIIFLPLLKLLHALGVTGNMVSYLSALSGLASAIWVWHTLKISALLLLVAVLLDNLDGALARYASENRSAGGLTDCFTDQIVISATTISYIATGIVNPVVGGLYLVTYQTVTIFAILRNLLGKPYRFVLRPRIVVYSAFVLFAFTSLNIMDYVTLPCAIIQLISIIFGFQFFRRLLK